MTSKQNRRTSNTRHEKYDSDLLFEIKKHLRKVYRIPFKHILIEPVLQLRNGKYEVVALSASPMEISFMAKHNLIHTPDIVIIKHEKPHLVIELDGASHESDRMVKKDRERNRHYHNAGILLIVINTAKMRSEGIPWCERIDEGMKKFCMEPEPDER